MEFDHVICFGHNCVATEICKEIHKYSGCSPTDWTITTPKSFAKILASLYVDGIEETTEKFCHFNSETKNEFGIWAPHHNPQGIKKPGAPEYFPESNTKEKMHRRFERLQDFLQGNKKLLFLYISHFKPIKKITNINEEPFLSFRKINQLISLYRNVDTYRICFLDINFQETLVEELKKENIDYLEGVLVDQDREDCWVWPCLNILHSKYGLKNKFFH